MHRNRIVNSPLCSGLFREWNTSLFLSPKQALDEVE